MKLEDSLYSEQTILQQSGLYCFTPSSTFNHSQLHLVVKAKRKKWAMKLGILADDRFFHLRISFISLRSLFRVSVLDYRNKGEDLLQCGHGFTNK